MKSSLKINHPWQYSKRTKIITQALPSLSDYTYEINTVEKFILILLNLFFGNHLPFCIIPIYCYLLYDDPRCHELREIESRASRLTERTSERAAIAKIAEETIVFSSPVLQFRYVGAICSRVKKRLVASSKALRARNKIDEIFTARVIWRGSRNHLQAVGLFHKVTRKFITIVIRPIHNTVAIYCCDIGTDIATARKRLLPAPSASRDDVAESCKYRKLSLMILNTSPTVVLFN